MVPPLEETTVRTPDLPRDSKIFPTVPMPTPAVSALRPHRCEVCQRSFREVATLRKHEQLHRADRPYVCQTCGKSFLWSSNLKVHERVHTGERPYKCKICHRCFTQSNDLRRHERNVHMRGKIYGYKNTGRQNSQVNLAAYQAFAMQQRALLQQALTYESYLQKSGQAAAAAQLFHRNQGLAGAGAPRLVGPGLTTGEGSATSPRSPLKLEQTESYELPHSRASGHPSFNNFRPMQRSLESLQAISLAQRHLTANSGHGHGTHLSDTPNLPHHSLRLPHDMVHLHQPHHSIHALATNNNCSISTADTNNMNGLIISNGQNRGGHAAGSPRMMSPSQQRIVEREMNERSENKMDENESRSTEEEYKLTRDRHNSMEYIRSDDQMERATSVEFPFDHQHHHQRHHEPPHHHHQLNHSPHHHSHQLDLTTDVNHSSRSSAPPASAIGSPDDRHPRYTPNHLAHNSNSGYPCDSVMDLSINKSSTSPPSRTSSNASAAADKEVSMAMPPPKTPTSLGGESESESGKRDVTTTSATPTADSGGIHHCHHCNIFFYDYTMFHLHESLHLPHEDDPFRCPSCGTHCQDRIEFMFHTVWHVKYPHTIPNYMPFREGILSSP